MNKIKSYAQTGQGLIALEFFDLYPAHHKLFLDIGAFDGIGFSNSRLLFEKGWNGVCIDVEEHEMSVLRGFDLQKYEPSLLFVEYSSPKERRELILYMKIQGYFSWIDNGQDIFFVYRLASKNWKVFLYGCYQQLGFSRSVRYATRLVRQFGQ